MVCDGDPCNSFAALPAIGDYPGWALAIPWRYDRIPANASPWGTLFAQATPAQREHFDVCAICLDGQATVGSRSLMAAKTH